jgi:DNA-binding NarL/FixJ family response regulator
VTASSPTPPHLRDPAYVLLAEPSLPYRSVIREALMSFRRCIVDEAPNAERAFELALQRPYQLLIVSLALEDIPGGLLHRLLARAYPLAHPGFHTAPPVIFIARATDTMILQELQRDARVRGSLTYPPRLDALLAMTQSILPERAGTPLLHVP